MSFCYGGRLKLPIKHKTIGIPVNCMKETVPLPSCPLATIQSIMKQVIDVCVDEMMVPKLNRLVKHVSA